MKRQIIEGEPVFRTHECSDDRGETMTSAELLNNTEQVVMDEYSEMNPKVVWYDKKLSNHVDSLYSIMVKTKFLYT